MQRIYVLSLTYQLWKQLNRGQTHEHKWLNEEQLNDELIGFTEQEADDPKFKTIDLNPKEWKYEQCLSCASVRLTKMS